MQGLTDIPHFTVTMALSCIVSKMRRVIWEKCTFYTPCTNSCKISVGSFSDDKNVYGKPLCR